MNKKSILVYDIPVEVCRKFKAVCAHRGTSMSKVLREYIIETVGQVTITVLDKTPKT